MPCCKQFWFLLIPAGLFGCWCYKCRPFNCPKESCKTSSLSNFVWDEGGSETWTKLSYTSALLEDGVQGVSISRTVLKKGCFGVWCIVLWSRNFLYECISFLLPNSWIYKGTWLCDLRENKMYLMKCWSVQNAEL